MTVNAVHFILCKIISVSGINIKIVFQIQVLWVYAISPTTQR